MATTSTLVATGERLIPDEYNATYTDRLIYLTHTATYEFAKKFARGRVLDLGCGAGYGTAMVSKAVDKAVGVDVDVATVAAANNKYGDARTSFTHIQPSEQAPLPFANESFDTVLSFQVIEHVKNPVTYLREAFRVLKPEGTLVLATPDRRTRLWRWQKPWNRHHFTEFTPNQIEGLLRVFTADVEIKRMILTGNAQKAEDARTKRMRLLTVPVTLPIVPELLRKKSLAVLRKVSDARRASPNTSSGPSVDKWPATSASDVAIDNAREPGLNILAVARKHC